MNSNQHFTSLQHKGDAKIDSSKQLEILYDHYKDTYQLLLIVQKRRNKEYMYLFTLEALLYFMLIEPYKIIIMLTAGIEKFAGKNLNVGSDILQTFIWGMILYVLIRYIQDSMYIERQYTYLSKLEKSIVTISGIDIFNREGDNYIQDYPNILNIIDLYYKMILPIGTVIINSCRIYEEILYVEESKILLVCDIIIFFVIFAIMWYYFFEIHPQITVWCKKNIPFIDSIGNTISKLLKKV